MTIPSPIAGTNESAGNSKTGTMNQLHNLVRTNPFAMALTTMMTGIANKAKTTWAQPSSLLLYIFCLLKVRIDWYKNKNQAANSLKPV